MGIIYKLKPEIKNWILEKKRANLILSCRNLISLIEEEFKIKVSKSSINSLFKEAGLSLPIGRRQKKRRPVPEIPPQPPTEAPLLETPMQMASEILQKILTCGAILLKATDYLIGGSRYMCEIIKRRLNLKDEHLLTKIESLIYASFLEPSQTPLKSYLNELKVVEPLIPDILRTLSRLLTDVRCIKVLLANQEALYLDGQLHTVWSVPHIPYGFANTIQNIKDYLEKSFSKGEPFVLFMAPGYDKPTAEFLNFILSLGRGGGKIAGIGLYGNKLEEIEFINLGGDENYALLFGLWPWQFAEYRRVKKIGDFKPLYFEAQRKNFYLADITLQLQGFDKNSSLNFFGCALKYSLLEKTRLMIISNLPEGAVQSEYLANLYLSHWPNLEEAFQDFSRKVELFTYTADLRNLFSLETMNFARQISDIEQLFNYYLKALELYFRQHFLPSGYADKDFSTFKEEFYRIKTKLQPHKDYILATFQPPQGFAHLKALEYACRRLNERKITLTDQRLWLSL